MSCQSNGYIELIGAIVLVTQDIEHHLKFLIPYMGTDEREVERKLASRSKLSKQTFGQLVGAFVQNSSFGSDRDLEHFEHLINFRNEIVHHFSKTYGPQIESGKIDDVINTLRTHLININQFRDALIQISELIVESISDSSPE